VAPRVPIPRRRSPSPATTTLSLTA